MLYVIRSLQDDQGNIIPEQLLSFYSARWLRHFDPDAYDGRGSVQWTNDLGQARKFSDVAKAAKFYQQQSKVRPLREDGKPNRPLTGYTLALETFDAPELSQPTGIRKWWWRLRMGI